MRYITAHDHPASGLRGIADISWHCHAACSGMDPKEADTIFFPTARNFGAINQAKAHCGHCPVREVCLTSAIDTDSTEGIWGGRTETERHILHKNAELRYDRARIKAVLAGRDIRLSTTERDTVILQAAARGWSRQRLASVLGVGTNHARDLLSQARNQINHAAGQTTPPRTALYDYYDETAQDERTGAEQFEDLEGPTDAELAGEAA